MSEGSRRLKEMLQPSSVLRKISQLESTSRIVSALEMAQGDSPNLLRVLTYHRIGDAASRPDLYPNILSANPRGFSQQMQMLAEKFTVISMPELIARLDAKEALPPRSVLITFDDAYTDFEELAWPVMKELGLSATLFVPTAYPDQPDRSFWWDRVHQAVHGSTSRDTINTPAGSLAVATGIERGAAVKALTQYIKSLPHHDAMQAVDELCRDLGAQNSRNDVLGWEALRRLAQDGVTLGAHTQTHPLMNRMSLEEARDEAVGSLRDIEREIGSQPPVLAYPAGGCTVEVARMLESEGFKLAFTTERGLNDMASADRLLLRRINIGRGTTTNLLRVQMLPLMKHASRWLP